jgi:hypothetical protein
MAKRAVRRWPEGRNPYKVMATNQVEPAGAIGTGLKSWLREDCLECGCPAAAIAAMRTKSRTVVAGEILAVQTELDAAMKTRNFWQALQTEKGRNALIERIGRIKTKTW